jgi:hypothetical protein
MQMQFFSDFSLIIYMHRFLTTKPHKKSPPFLHDGDFDCTDLVADQSAVNGINATLRARLIAVVSSR